VRQILAFAVTNFISFELGFILYYFVCRKKGKPSTAVMTTTSSGADIIAELKQLLEISRKELAAQRSIIENVQRPNPEYAHASDCPCSLAEYANIPTRCNCRF
jgi:hypothetical protein